MLGWLRRRDAAVSYAVVVLVLAVAIGLLPGRLAQRFVINSSTNLANLRSHPPYVLLVSAFVISPLWQVWILAPAVWVYGEIQRWLGRGSVLVVAVLGHVGATLFVATMISAGIAHGQVSLAEARGADVGVSYGLVTAMGLLAARLPVHRRAGGLGWVTRDVYVGLVSAALVLLLVLDRSFTDLGHLSAWGIGLSLAWLLVQASRHPSVVTSEVESGLDDGSPPLPERRRPIG